MDLSPPQSPRERSGKTFKKSNYFSVNPPRLLRQAARSNERREFEEMEKLRKKYKDVPDDMFWEIFEYIKRNSKSISGGRKTRKTYN